MAFPPEVTELAWTRSGQRCECSRPGHDHKGRCNKPLVWANRCYYTAGGWEQRHIDQSAGDDASNCEILCYDCFRRVRAGE